MGTEIVVLEVVEVYSIVKLTSFLRMQESNYPIKERIIVEIN